MNISEHQIDSIVDQVIKQISQSSGNSGMGNNSSSNATSEGMYDSLDDAVAAARKAFNEYSELKVATKKNIISTIRASLRDHAKELAKMAVEETKLGRYEDKIIKNLLVINKTPGIEFLETKATTNDYGLVLHERAAWGVIGSITPTTNPSETIINNTISFIAAGNTGVFNPHPGAKKTSAFTVNIINRACVKAGGPANIITAINEPTIQSANALMTHSDINLVVVTGGPGVVKAAFKSGKKVICGGPGNPPAIVDETAKIEKAGRDIVLGHSFDNNVICTDEKEVIVVNSIADDLIDSMRANGAYLINKSQTDRLTSIILSDKGRPGCGGHTNKNFVGKNANVILSEIGINVGEDVKCVLCDVENDHPLIWTEQLMPVLPITRVESAKAGIALGIAAEQGCNHTASIHSLNIENLSIMARAFQGSILVKNASNYSGLGEIGPGYTSFTIASPTGDGLTTCQTFSRQRHCCVVDYFRIV